MMTWEFAILRLIFFSLVSLLGLAFIVSGSLAMIDKKITLISKNFPMRETRHELTGTAAVVFGIFHSFCGILFTIRGVFGIFRIELDTIFWNGLCGLFLIFIIQTTGITLAGLVARRTKTT